MFNLIPLFDIFKTSGFTAHASCIGLHEIVLQNFLGDIMVASSAFVMGGILWSLAARRKGLNFNSLLTWFGVFSVMCGVTHVMSIVVLFVPLYVLSGWCKILAGVSAWVTLYKLIPQILPLVHLSDEQIKNVQLLREAGELNAYARSVREQNEAKAMRLQDIAGSISEYAESMRGKKPTTSRE